MVEFGRHLGARESGAKDFSFFIFWFLFGFGETVRPWVSVSSLEKSLGTPATAPTVLLYKERLHFILIFICMWNC